MRMGGAAHFLDTEISHNLCTALAASGHGGQVTQPNSFATFVNCRVTMNGPNRSISSSTPGSTGGGVDLDGGSVHLVGSLFAGNQATTGGALYLSSAVQVTITNCTIGTADSPNMAQLGGGLMIKSVLAMNGTLVSSNIAAEGGGIALGQGGRGELAGCKLVGNSAQKSKSRRGGNGGAVYLTIADALNPYTRTSINVTCMDCTIVDNRADMDGGGVYVPHSSTLELRNTLVSRNIALRHGGGIWMHTPNEAVRTLFQQALGRNSITWNIASSGGGAFLYLEPKEQNATGTSRDKLLVPKGFHNNTLSGQGYGADCASSASFLSVTQQPPKTIFPSATTDLEMTIEIHDIFGQLVNSAEGSLLLSPKGPEGVSSDGLGPWRCYFYEGVIHSGNLSRGCTAPVSMSPVLAGTDIYVLAQGQGLLSSLRSVHTQNVTVTGCPAGLMRCDCVSPSCGCPAIAPSMDHIAFNCVVSPASPSRNIVLHLWRAFDALSTAAQVWHPPQFLAPHTCAVVASTAVPGTSHRCCGGIHRSSWHLTALSPRIIITSQPRHNPQSYPVNLEPCPGLIMTTPLCSAAWARWQVLIVALLAVVSLLICYLYIFLQAPFMIMSSSSIGIYSCLHTALPCIYAYAGGSSKRGCSLNLL